MNRAAATDALALSPTIRLGALALVLGCGGCGSDDPEESSEAASTAPATSAGSSGPQTGSSTTGTSGEASTSTSGSSSSESTNGFTTTPPPPDIPPPEPKFCSLLDVDPDATVEGVVDAGDAEGQIPTIVGEALVRNCGCHYSDNVLPMYVDFIDETMPMATLDDFFVAFDGVFPANFDGLVHEAIEQRVVFVDPLPMPPIECSVEGEDGTISQADLQIFTDWLAAGAPDGANFPPR